MKEQTYNKEQRKRPRPHELKRRKQSHVSHEGVSSMNSLRGRLSKGNQDSRRRDTWNTGNKDKENGRRSGKQEDSKALVTLDGEGVDWTSHSEDEQENYALMACSSSGSDTEVTSCSKECKESYAKLKKLYDEQREQLGDASIEIQAYTQALKKVEAQLVAHQQSQLWYEEKIRFMKIDLDDKTDVLTYHKKLLAEAEKEKEDLKAKVEKWHNSSKNLNILLNSQMSAKDKAGLGYGDQMNKSVLSYENEVFQSVFVSRTSDIEDSPVNDRYAEGMHAVPPPMTGIYIPSGPDKEIDDSQFTYGPKQSKPSESDARSSDFNSCESNCSEETHESMPEPVVNEPKVVSEPKVWSDAPIIEEYESDSEDEHVSLPSKEQETPSFAFINTVKHVKTPRQTVIEQNTCSQSPKPDKKDCSGLMSKKLGLGFGYTKKACFVCGSFSHLIRDCDFHEKRMAKQAELNNRMSKGSSQREIRPVWNNVQRMNHQNQFVPKAVLTRTGKIPVNTARTSGTNTVNTARNNFNRQAVPINAARKVNTVKPIVTNVRPKAGFHKSVSPFRKSFNKTTALRTNFSKQKVNTAEVNALSVVKGKRETAVKSSAGMEIEIGLPTLNEVSRKLMMFGSMIGMAAAAQNTNNSTIRSILHAEKLTGSNFTNWHCNLRIVLRYEKKLKFVEQPMAPAPDPETADPYTIDKPTEDFGEIQCEWSVGKLISLEDEELLGHFGTTCMGKTIAELHAMVKLYEKGIPKKAETPAVLAIREGRIQKDKKKPKGEKGLVLQGYALESASRIVYMVPTEKLDRTSYKIWHDKAPKISYLEVWGCEFFENSVTLQEASRSHILLKASESDVGLELIHKDDTQPSEDTIKRHDEVEPNKVEP
ncbi:hypothetical protein Tco_0627542 [Tanacetum coccineum]|uniref:CCHC-type domain-containing protein n=1 Tax=Tanacetum coccineum TaxID=301880 RepID=A0ABQ4WMP7_9ASTR